MQTKHISSGLRYGIYDTAAQITGIAGSGFGAGLKSSLISRWAGRSEAEVLACLLGCHFFHPLAPAFAFSQILDHGKTLACEPANVRR